MIVDSSALVAVLLRQPGFERVLERLVAEPGAGVGAPTPAKAGIVLAAPVGDRGRTLLGRLVAEADLAPIPFADDHWPVAIDAYARFGKSRHPAGLNFGDCLTYAIARAADEPLLCVGGDFARTDLALA